MGRPEPLGASIDPETYAVNFALVSSTARSVSLCLFTEEDLKRGRVTADIILDPMVNRTGDVWHILLPSLPAGLLYGYRVGGRHQLVDPLGPGLRHDESKVILGEDDP